MLSPVSLNEKKQWRCDHFALRIYIYMYTYIYMRFYMLYVCLYSVTLFPDCQGISTPRIIMGCNKALAKRDWRTVREEIN